jgi:hypothetical protein
MKSTTQKITTPVGELRWVFITGDGKEDLQGRPRYTASLVLKEDSQECQKLLHTINEFWEENKPKGATKPKSVGVHPVTDTGRRDGTPTGYLSFDFWTGTAFENKAGVVEPKVVKTYNAKAAQVDLCGKEIGNGSRGAISGSMGIYNKGVNKGVTLYLNSVQITKFVERDDNAFTAVEDSESDEGFEGFLAGNNTEGFTSV